ncbi:MAG: sulfatase-like hydrolase/transferase, partial [Planctomycetaceae bacterium]|nr:sulfatase-like hydrolase/transferase [Planctomycetaceae bacterium]
IVLILADDLGYADLGVYGNTVNRTPHLDRLAKEGIRFTDFHTNGSNCSPTRAALLTGLYQQRVGIEGPLGEGARGLSQDSVTVAEKLRDVGYATGMMGKWHLGYAPENGPTHHGFEEFVGHLHGATDYISHVDKYGRMDWWHNEKPSPEKGYNTTLITRHSVDFIEKHQQKPFFLFISHSAIHFPWMIPQDKAHRLPGMRYEGKFGKLGPHAEGPVQPIVKQMIEELDSSVGEIVATLERLKLSKRTLVFFTSDNGGILRVAGVPPNKENIISLNTPFRGQKHGLYEGGHRVPAMAWWPGKIKAGQVSNELSITTDLMPTLLELANIQPVSTDGVSLATHLIQGSSLPERTLFWSNGNSKAVRWKQWKLVRIHEHPFELYDLNQNVSEVPKHNLIDTRKDIRDDLMERLHLWELSVSK